MGHRGQWSLTGKRVSEARTFRSLVQCGGAAWHAATTGAAANVTFRAYLSVFGAMAEVSVGRQQCAEAERGIEARSGPAEVRRPTERCSRRGTPWTLRPPRRPTTALQATAAGAAGSPRASSRAQGSEEAADGSRLAALRPVRQGGAGDGEQERIVPPRRPVAVHTAGGLRRRPVAAPSPRGSSSRQPMRPAADARAWPTPPHASTAPDEAPPRAVRSSHEPDRARPGRSAPDDSAQSPTRPTQSTRPPAATRPPPRTSTADPPPPAGRRLPRRHPHPPHHGGDRARRRQGHLVLLRPALRPPPRSARASSPPRWTPSATGSSRRCSPPPSTSTTPLCSPTTCRTSAAATASTAPSPSTTRPSASA